VAEWEHDFLLFMHDQKPEIRKKIVETNDLDDAAMATLIAAIGQFKSQFATKQPAKEAEKKPAPQMAKA